MIEREKTLDKKLKGEVEASGYKYIKLPSRHDQGLPDRMIIARDRVAFAELKGTGKKPTAMQLYWLEELRRLGHLVALVDSSAAITELMAELRS